jgi:hypothetical protein
MRTGLGSQKNARFLMSRLSNSAKASRVAHLGQRTLGIRIANVEPEFKTLLGFDELIASVPLPKKDKREKPEKPDRPVGGRYCYNTDKKGPILNRPEGTVTAQEVEDALETLLKERRFALVSSASA